MFFLRLAAYRPNGLLDFFDQITFFVRQVMPIHKSHTILGLRHLGAALYGEQKKPLGLQEAKTNILIPGGLRNNHTTVE